MAPILVTGGAGFIGSHTCKALAAQNFIPVAFDNLSRGSADFVRWGPFVQGDIRDAKALEDLFKQYQPRSVIHFAALAYVGESFQEALSYYEINVSGFINLLKVMVRHGTENIVLSSTCATYGIPKKIPIPETAPQKPINPYGRSKLACEQILADTAKAHQLRFATLRYFNACGADPQGDLVERHEPETHLIPLAIDAAGGKGPPLRIFGTDYPTADGTCERDFIHVSDLANVHIDALQLIEKGYASLIVNLGTGRAHSILEVVSGIERLTGRTVPVINAPRRSGDPPTLVADPSLAQKRLRFKPRYSDLETIIQTTWRSRNA